MIRDLVAALARRAPSPRVISGADGSPYLSRWTLLDLGPSHVRVHVHRFHRSDEDLELHNHPWRWALGVILAGGYREERRDESGAVFARNLRPGAVNLIYGDTFHRVDLLAGECWTLFIAGPVAQSWGFWDRTTGTFTAWREFIRSKGLVPVVAHHAGGGR